MSSKERNRVVLQRSRRDLINFSLAGKVSKFYTQVYMNPQEHMTPTEDASPVSGYSRETYENASQQYEAIITEIGGDKSDEELLELMIARTDARDKLAELYSQAWKEADDTDNDFDEANREAKAFSKLPRAEQLKELLRREFSRGVAHIPEGRFTSDLPGIEQLTVLHPTQSASGTSPRSFSVYASHVDPETKKHSAQTFTVTDEGQVLGPIPSRWNFTKEELTEELVRLVDDVGGAFFVDTNEAILPRGTWGTETREQKGSTHVPKSEVVDRRRLRFFKNQPGALFGFRGTTSSEWQGYHGFAFTDRIILDAPKVGNAVYVLPLPNEFPVNPDQLFLPPCFRMKEEGRARYLSEHWAPYAGLTKKESLESGATRVIHPDYATVDDQWEKNMREKLDTKIRYTGVGK